MVGRAVPCPPRDGGVTLVPLPIPDGGQRTARPTFPPPSLAHCSVTYIWLANSARVDQIVFTHGGTNVITTSNEFENLGLTLATTTVGVNGPAIIDEETMPKRTKLWETPFSLFP